MALQGTLDSFSLPDVLRLLADTGKTGRLLIEGDRGQGSVWIDDGSIVAAGADRALDDAPVDEVVFELLRFGDGSFVFAADEQAADAEDPTDVETALRRATELLDEWRELEAVVPSLEHRVAIAPELTVDKVTVDAARWTTLVALAGGVSVGELGESLGMGELAVSRTVSDLVELGVAVIEEPQAKPRRSAGTGRRPRTDRRTSKNLRSEASADGGYPALTSDAAPRAGWRRDDSGQVPVGLNGRNGSTPDADVTSPRAARSGEVPRNDDGVRAADAAASAPGSEPSSGNGLPRRSRATGRRAGGRQVGTTGVAVPPKAANPPSSPFTNGSVMPPAPTSGPGLAGLPPFNNNDAVAAPVLPASLDAGPLGPSPLVGDTGQIPLVAPSSLPADLSWAAEDDEDHLGQGGPLSVPSPPMGTPPVVPPAPPSMGTPLSAPPREVVTELNTAPSPVAEGDTAPHIAVMSPGAQLAIEAAVGRSGGGPGVVPAAGATPEETMQRGALLGFLSTVRQ